MQKQERGKTGIKIRREETEKEGKETTHQDMATIGPLEKNSQRPG